MVVRLFFRWGSVNYDDAQCSVPAASLSWPYGSVLSDGQMLLGHQTEGTCLGTTKVPGLTVSVHRSAQSSLGSQGLCFHQLSLTEELRWIWFGCPAPAHLMARPEGSCAVAPAAATRRMPKWSFLWSLEATFFPALVFRGQFYTYLILSKGFPPDFITILSPSCWLAWKHWSHSLGFVSEAKKTKQS